MGYKEPVTRIETPRERPTRAAVLKGRGNARVAVALATASTLAAASCGSGDPTGPSQDVGARASVASPVPTTRAKRASGDFRLVGKPIVVDRDRSFDVFFRMNRKLPTYTNGEGYLRYGATVRVGGAVAPFPPDYLGRRSRRCYLSTVDIFPDAPRSTRNARAGSRIRLAIRPRNARQTLRRTVTLIEYITDANAARRLGCG